jgi:hypothetical protein
LRQKIKEGGGFYHGRPTSTPKPEFEFGLDYDFNKHDVDSLSNVFGKGCWEVADMISSIVHEIDPSAKGMYEGGGRQSRFRRNSYSMSTRFHGHGQQLGWHAMFFAAGKLLRDFPVTDDWYYENDPWGEWLHRYLLTRDDGFWLSDGTDRTPLEVVESLLEKGGEELALTGDRVKLSNLIGLAGGVRKEIVVYGTWHSSDSVRIHVSSALVRPKDARRFIKDLRAEDPMIVWVPSFSESEEDDEYLRGEKKEYTPWIVCPSGETRLDEHDPFGTPTANIRPRISRDFAATLGLRLVERFGRAWQGKSGATVVRAEAWGRKEPDDDSGRERGPHPGLRLSCSTSSLKKLLSKHDKDLLVLVNLQRYKKGYRDNGKYAHTVAVVRLTKSLKSVFAKGCVNRPYVFRY